MKPEKGDLDTQSAFVGVVDRQDKRINFPNISIYFTLESCKSREVALTTSYNTIYYQISDLGNSNKLIRYG